MNAGMGRIPLAWQFSRFRMAPVARIIVPLKLDRVASLYIMLMILFNHFSQWPNGPAVLIVRTGVFHRMANLRGKHDPYRLPSSR